MFFLFQPIRCTALELSASSAVLYEPVSERYIFQKNSDVKRGIASTTKILTAITALIHGNLSDTVVTSAKAAEVEGSSVWLEEGECQTLENMLYALLLASGNDASIAIAEHIAGSEEKFALLMNQTAKIAGATRSNFVNSSGLYHDNHYSTAEDLAKIMAFAERNKLFKKIVSTQKYSIPWEGHPYDRTIKNHNKLLTMYEWCTGGKTGYTQKCGRCLVSSASQNGINLIAVTLNAPDDWNDHIQLFNYGFSVLQQYTHFEKGEYAGDFPVKDGVKQQIRTVYASSCSIPVLSNDVIETEKILSVNNTAPIEKGAVVGYENLKINNQIVETIDIVADEPCFKKEQINFRSVYYKILKKLF